MRPTIIIKKASISKNYGKYYERKGITKGKVTFHI